MSSLTDTSFEARNNMWVRRAQGEARTARQELVEAEARIAKLEDALVKSHKNSNGVIAVLDALKAEIEQLNPNSHLLGKENRLKIYKAHYKL